MSPPPPLRPLALLAGCLLLAPSAAPGFVSGDGSLVPPEYDTLLPPEQGAVYVDTVFGTEVLRVSDALGSPNNVDGGNLTFVMTEYATMSAFNQDRSSFLLQHDSYFGLYDGEGNYLRDLPVEIDASSEPRWSRTDPDILYFIDANRLQRYDVGTETISTVRTFTEYTEISGRGESDICFDGNHLVLAGDGHEIFVYDLATDEKGLVLDTSLLGGDFDSLHITPEDNVIITWIESGTDLNQGVELYDRNMVFLRQLTPAGGHMDVTRNADGEEVLVWANSADPEPICDNGIVEVRLSDATQTCLLSLAWELALHVSAPDDGGFVVVSTYAPSDPDPEVFWPPYTNEILRVRLDGTGADRLVHHRSRPYNTVNYQPRATVSRDGERVLYSSNYNLQEIADAPAEYSDAYLLDLTALFAAGFETGDLSEW